MNELAQAIAAVVAAFLNYEAPTPPPPPPVVEVVEASAEVLGEPHVVSVDSTEETVVVDYTFNADGWVTYRDGAVKCVTGAPCDDTPGLTSADFTYDWNTGVVYGDTLETEES